MMVDRQWFVRNLGYDPLGPRASRALRAVTAKRPAGSRQDLAREIYVSSARTSPVLQEVIHNYASRVGITLKAKYEGENISSAMSLVASTGGISLVPLYAQNMLAPNVVARALEGGTPTVDLALGYNRTNPSPLLRRLLSRADELVANVQNQSIIRYVEAD